MKALVFTSPTCAPCKVYKGTVKTATSLGANIKVLDVIEDADMADLYGIRTVPTTVILSDDDQLVDVLFGVQSVAVLMQNLGLGYELVG